VQPLQAILFGNLTQDFVTFTIVLLKYQEGDEEAKQQLPLAAANFRHAAGTDATYLVYLGMWCCFVAHSVLKSSQELDYLCAHLYRCTFGSILVNSTPRGFESTTSKPYFVRISLILTILGLGKLPLEFKQIPVSVN
jgi:hypothetical protein